MRPISRDQLSIEAGESTESGESGLGIEAGESRLATEAGESGEVGLGTEATEAGLGAESVLPDETARVEVEDAEAAASARVDEDARGSGSSGESRDAGLTVEVGETVDVTDVGEPVEEALDTDASCPVAVSSTVSSIGAGSRFGPARAVVSPNAPAASAAVAPVAVRVLQRERCRTSSSMVGCSRLPGGHGTLAPDLQMMRWRPESHVGRS